MFSILNGVKLVSLLDVSREIIMTHHFFNFGCGHPVNKGCSTERPEVLDRSGNGATVKIFSNDRSQPLLTTTTKISETYIVHSLFRNV